MNKKKWYVTWWGVILILSFWPFFAVYFLYKLIKKAQNQTTPNVQQSVSSTSNIGGLNLQISVDGEDMGEYVNGMRTIPKNAKLDSVLKDHVTKLASFYREYCTDYDGQKDSKAKVLQQVCPRGDAHTCPYCGVIHEFSASRARKCPDCGKQMIVRNSVFMTDDQATDYDQAIQQHYDNASIARQLKNSIGQVQDYVLRGNYGQALLEVAESYQMCAVIHNVKDANGYSAWDYAWGVLNGELMAITTAGAKNAQELVGNGYADLLFARGKHALWQMKYSETQAAYTKYAKLAIDLFYNYLFELAGAGLKDWKREDAVKFIATARQLGKISDETMGEIELRAKTTLSTKPSPETISGVIREVHDYVYLETDPAQIKQMIY